MPTNIYDDALDSLDQQQQPATAAPPNPYDSILDEQDTRHTQRLRTSVLQADQTTPDRAAESLRLSQESGLPVDVVQRNFDAYQKRAQLAGVDRLVRESPHLSEWLAADPVNAAIAKDDHPSLSALERTLGIGRNVAGALGEGVMGFSQGIWGAIRAGAEALSGEPPISGLNRMAGQLPPTTIPGLVTPGTVNLYRQPKVQNPDGSTSTVDSLSVNLDGKEVLLPTVTPEGQHFTGTEDERVNQAIAQFEKTGQHLGMFETPEAATAYAQKLHDDYAAGVFDRLPLTERIAEFAGLTALVAASLAERSKGPQTGAGWTEQQIYGGVASIGQMAPGLVIGAVTGGAGLLATAGISTGGQSYTQAREQGVSAETALLFGGIQGAVEVATEFIPAHRLLGDLAAKTPLIKTLMHQVASEIPGEEIATVLQDLNEWAVLPVNKDRTFSDYLKERPSAAAATLISTVTAVGMTTVTAHGTARMVEKLGETAAESKTIQRSPEAAQAFIAQAVKDGPMETLYQPVDTWTSYWESKGMDPAQMAADLTGSVDAYQRALATGQDLEIPTARYAVKLAATEHNAFFANELRIAPDEMNAREAEQFQTDLAAQATAEPQPLSPIRTALLAELTAAGVEGSTAESYATLYESAIGSVAERAGVDPTALYEKYGLKVERPGISAETPANVPGEVPATTLAQSAATLEAPAQQLTLDEEVARITDQPPPVRQERRQTAGAAGVSPTGIERRADQPITGTLAERMAQMRAENPDIQKQGAQLAERARLAKPAQPPRVVHTVASEVAEMTAREFGPQQTELFQSQSVDEIPDYPGREVSDRVSQIQHVPLRLIEPTETVDSAAVTRMVEAIKAGEPLPAIVVEFSGENAAGEDTLSVIDGHTRLAAALQLGDATIPVRVVVQAEDWAKVKAAGGLKINGAVSEFGQPLTGDGEEKRGAIRFGADRQFTIALLEKADLSTFLHETGHFFLEVFGDLADQVSAVDASTHTPEQAHLVADYQSLLKRFGVESRADIQTEHHEQFAREFEAYLMEGKAPTVQLQGAFSRFRAWLLGIYSSLKNLNVTLTPEVRGVLDRLVASDQAIADAEARRNVAPIFTTAEDAGMTEKEFGLYTKTIADASRSARETLDAQLMKDVRREQTQTWKKQREAVRAVVTDEIRSQPIYTALEAIQRGVRSDNTPLIEGQEPTPLKISKAAIVDRYGADILKRLPRPYVYTVEGGLHQDTLAEMFGFSSGDELIQAIIAAPPMKTVIDQETSRRMLAEHGNLLLDGTLHEKARAAVENEDREKVIRAELQALGKLRRTVDPFLRQQQQQGRASARQITTATPSMAVLRDTARATIAAMQVRAITPQTYWSASRRAAQLAFDAAAKQDVTGAITAKNQELFNLALYREANTRLADVEMRVRFATDLGKTASRQRLGLAGSTYLDQVDGILDRFEFATVPQKTLNRRARIRDWMEAVAAQGIPVEDLPVEILDDARRVNYKELTVEELIGVTDGLKQILHLARLKNKLLASTDEREFDAIRDGISTSIRDLNPARTKVMEFRPSDQKWRAVAGWFASHTKIAILARALDGHQDAGPLWSALIRPINAAADAETTRKGEDGRKLAAIVEAAYPGRELGTLNEKLFIPALNGSLSKEGRLAVALNWGNQQNRERILADPNRGWSPQQVKAILDTLDERDWNFVQSTWDFLNGYWQEIAEKQERVTGLAPEKVEALQIETAFGAFKGGYYPLAYDGRLSPRADQHAAATEAKLAVAGAYVSSTTRRGHTKTRQENVKLSVRLELGVAFSHIESVIHDLTHHEMLIDTTRLMRDPAIRDAILDTKGDLTYEQFTTALQDIALGSSNGQGKPTVLDKSAAWMKTGTQLSGLGWNLWTAAQQPLGIFNGMSRVGPTWVAKGMKRWLRDSLSMESTSKWIADVSPMMRERVTTGTQDLHDLKSSIKQPGGWFDTMVRTVSADKVTQQTIVDSYLWHIGLMQRVADIPTWLGGYEKAMAAGHDEATAIALADQGVLDSQGGGQVKDLAQIQRGGPVAKLFLTFYSYGNTVYNATAEKAGATNFKSPADVATFLGHLSLLYLLPAVGTVTLSRLLGKSGGGDKDDLEKWLHDVGRETLSSAMNTMVLVRELGGLVQEGTRGYAGPAGTRMIELAYNLGKQVKQGEADEALFKAINSAAGVIFRYPAGQVARTVDGWVALQEGRTANPAALLVGAPKRAAK